MKILVLDTETANMVEQPLPYDLGYQIIDTDTWEVLAEHSYIIAEIFLDKNLMNSAYYAEKVPKYRADLNNGTREMRRLLTIRRTINEEMKRFNCHTVAAYNLGFDRRACNNDIRYITSSSLRWFFPYGVELIDIWTMACSSFLRTAWFIKWAIKNNFVSKAGNIQTSAEIAYRYLIKNPDFAESHTGLEDVKIEVAILKKVMTSPWKYKTAINPACWRIPQKKWKAMKEGE